MKEPVINILTRTSNRHAEFTKCIKSIRSQIYKNIRLIICTDKPDQDHEFILNETKGLPTTIITTKFNGTPYSWNLYCNDLKNEVTEGWFFYLDDDDYLINKRCLLEISKHLSDENKSVICRFRRGKRIKPFPGRQEVIRGNIGGSCIFLHHSQKHIAEWDDKRAADYRFIKAVESQLKFKFVDTVVVQTGNNGRHGQ